MQCNAMQRYVEPSDRGTAITLGGNFVLERAQNPHTFVFRRDAVVSSRRFAASFRRVASFRRFASSRRFHRLASSPRAVSFLRFASLVRDAAAVSAAVPAAVIA